MLGFASIFLENNLGDLLALLTLGLLFLLRVDDVSSIIALVSQLLNLFTPFDLLRTQVAVASANGNALERHSDNVLRHVRFDICGATHAWTQRHLRIRNQNLHLEICDFFLRTGPRRFASIRDLLDVAIKTPVAIGVDLHPRLITNFHIHNVILVYIHNRLHSGQIRHPHDFRAGELIGRDQAFTKFAV